LRDKGKKFGLKDKNHEIILGRALKERIARGYEGVEANVNVDELGATAREVEEGLSEWLAENAKKAFAGGAQALSNAIYLIPLASDSRTSPIIRDDIRPSLNVNNYSQILKAA